MMHLLLGYLACVSVFIAALLFLWPLGNFIENCEGELSIIIAVALYVFLIAIPGLAGGIYLFKYIGGL